MKQALQSWRLALMRAWQARTVRERQALRAGALCLLLAGLAQTVWWLHIERLRLLKQVPRLAADLEQMRALAQAWPELAAAEPAGRAPLAQPAIERSLAALGPGLRARWTADAALVIEGTVSWSDWLSWTAALQAEQGLQLQTLRLQAVGERLQIEARYARATP